MHPNCLTDGQFLADFFILHPDDCRYNAVNQRYWMEYHTKSTLYRPDNTPSYHLVKQKRDSTRYARSKGRYSYRQWIYLNHDDNYIHGPFDFTITPDGRQSRDRVKHSDWSVLHDMKHMYKNKAPALSHMVGPISIHCNTLFHSEVESDKVTRRLVTAPLISEELYS